MGKICCTTLFLLSLKQKPTKAQPLHPTLSELCNKKNRMWWICNKLVGKEANLELLNSQTKIMLKLRHK